MQMRDEKGRFCKKIESNLITVVGWKGCDSDFCCIGKQYKENTTFEEPKAKLCENGMHFCVVPWNVVQYYHIFDKDTGRPNIFAAVEGEIDKNTVLNIWRCDSKLSTTKLTVKTKLTFEEFCACMGSTKESKNISYFNEDHKYEYAYKIDKSYAFVRCKTAIVIEASQVYADCKEVIITAIGSMVYNVHKSSIIRALPFDYPVYVAGKKGTKIITRTREVVIDNKDYFEDTWYKCSSSGDIKQVYEKGVLAQSK